MSEDKKPNNEVRIGARSKPTQIITRCEKLIKEDKVKEFHLSAIGNTIGDVVVAAEILKSMYPQYYQQSIFSVIAPEPLKKDEKNAKKDVKKLFPRLEIILTTEKPSEIKEGSQKLSEEDRKILIDTLDKKKDAFQRMRRLRLSANKGRRNRRWGYGFSGRNRRFAFSAKRSNFGFRRPGFPANRRPFGKSPVVRKNNNMRKFNGNRKVSTNKPEPAKN